MDDRVRELLEQDAIDWPEGHPCRECGKLFKEHPHSECAEWS